MKSLRSHMLSYTSCIIVAFVITNNILTTFQYKFRLVPIKSIVRVGPSLGKMKQLRNSGHILCLKEPIYRREFCEKAFQKLPQLSSNYTLTDEKPPSEFAYRIVYAAGNDTPEVVFACGCPTEPLGIFLMGWVSHEKSIVEVLDYQSSKTAPLDKINVRGLSNDNITVEELREHFMVDFLKGQKFLLKRYGERMKDGVSVR